MEQDIIDLGEISTGGRSVQLRDFIDRKYANISADLGAKLLIKSGLIRVNGQVIKKPKHPVTTGDVVIRDSAPFSLTSPASRVVANNYLKRFEGAGGVALIPEISAGGGSYEAGGNGFGSIDLPSAAVTATD